MSVERLQEIGAWHLTGYFEFLDELRDSGATNMYGAGQYLRREYPGMTKDEERVVLAAWMETFDGKSLPEERAASLLRSHQRDEV